MEADLQEAALRLRDAPEAMPPAQRRDLVQTIADGLLCRELEQDPEVADLIEQLAADPDWAVRLEVARMVHLLGDELCSRLVAHFRGDCNRYVRRHAERSLVRQRKARQASHRQRSASSSYGDQLDQLERQHGKRLAAKVRSLADQRYAMLTSAVVHDVRSILTTLSSNAAALSREAAGSARARSIQEDVAYLRRTMEAVEQFTKPLPVQRHPEDLAQMIAQAVEKACGGVGQQGHDHTAVEITVSVQSSVRLRVARRLMVLALTNVIQNAIEAFAEHDQDVIAPGSIEVQAVVEGYATHLRVRDHGPGIEPEVLRELRTFIPGGPNKAKRGSSGWGLSLAHRYVAAHGGTLAIDSELDRGTTVTITLPMREATEGSEI